MAFFMKNAAFLQGRPKSMMLEMYDTLFHAAAFAGMTRKQQEDYMNWWRIRQDNYNADQRAKRIAREEGLAEGRAEGRAEAFALMAERLRKRGMSEEDIEGIIKQDQP